MSSKSARVDIIGAIACYAALAWFAAVISYQWTRDELPTSGFVCLMIFGLTATGGFAGLVICSIANICARIGPPKARLPFMVLVWAALMIPAFGWLVVRSADHVRALVAIAFLFVGGLCVGPINAESIVGIWFYRRARRKAEAELPLRQAEARNELEKV